MWFQEQVLISGKAASCNLWATTPQPQNAACGGWAELAASTAPERFHTPTRSGSGERTSKLPSFLSPRSLPVISFSGHPAQVWLYLFLPRASTRGAIAAFHFYSALLNLKSSSQLWWLQWLTLSAQSQRP